MENRASVPVSPFIQPPGRECVAMLMSAGKIRKHYEPLSRGGIRSLWSQIPNKANSTEGSRK
jgi:hypothetical protein